MTTSVMAAPPGVSPVRSRSLAAVLIAVGVPMFMVTLDNLVVTTALPVIRESLGASLADLSWFVNAYTLPFAALLLTAAAIGDRIGRRRLFVAGIALFTLASAACALATEPWMLTAARAVQGVGGAMVMPLSLTLLAAAVPERMRNAAIGIWGGISGLGVAVGPVVGGAVAEGLDWTWIFWLNVPIGLLAIVLVRAVLTESHGGRGRLDPLGLVLISTGMFALIWGVVHGEDGGWTSLSVLGTLIAGGVLIAAFVAWERRAPAPMLPLRLFRSRAFSAVNVVAFLFSVGVFGSVFLLAQFFQVVQGLGPFGSGIRTLPWTAAPMVVAPIAGLLVGRVGSRFLIVLGQVLLGAGLLWVALGTAVDVGFGSLAPAFVLAGIGMGLTFAPLSTVALASVDRDSQGVASGTMNMVREFGVAVGVAVLASIFAAHGSYATPSSYVDGLVPAVLVGAAVVGGAALAGLLLPGRRHYLTTPNSSY
ncbi:MFS transporter [Asanoa siamensis]|uniref:MFS transporter n=1 Tax=Asanoa siamensis TaxID=926357 RepID=A0ABQ4CJA2_9ACTN|nr:MFS transporter [Asanoa siamensis]GIF71374.1 MFS transporter [Asanoa siamensis]